MTYVILFSSSLLEAFICGSVFAFMQFSRTAYLFAFLITFVAIWLGSLCARLVVSWNLHPEYIYIIGAGVGVLFGILSSAIFCYAIGVAMLPPFLAIGAVVGFPLSLVNIRIWYKYASI